MSLLANSNAIESGGYPIQRSLRFRSSASAYLNRTFTTPTNNKIWTWSGWVKLGALGVSRQLLSAGSAGPVSDQIFIGDTNIIRIYLNGGYVFESTQVLRDPSAFYHLIVATDTTQATAANRTKVYLNGQQITAYTGTAITQNDDTKINSAVAHYISRYAASAAEYFDGYLAEVNFIDGQALTPSSFGQTDPVTGVWVPAKYTGTYGTNGFYLPFSDNTSATTLAYDKSGNGNNWTPNNISTTAGATYDSMTDVPTLTSTTASNFPTWNAVANTGGMTLANGNLNAASASVSRGIGTTMTFPSTGKFYAEMTVNALATNGNLGICYVQDSNLPSGNLTVSSTALVYHNNGGKYVNGVNSAYGNSYTNGDIIGIAVDVDGGTVTFYKNNASQGAITYATSGLNYVWFTYVYNGNVDLNCGQRPFSYTPPTGFKALNTFNLPDPTIKKPNQYMDATTYTATNANLSIANSGFQPDLVWIKRRNGAASHVLVDAIRGASKVLGSDTTNAEQTSTAGTGVLSFDASGFSLGTDTSTSGQTNPTGGTMVGWQWQAGKGTTSSNTSGSITSTVSVNTTAGFSVVTYTGNGTSGATVGHGLGVAPAMFIVKSRSTTGNWIAYHTALGVNKYIYVNQTVAAQSVTPFTALTSTTFALSQNYTDYNNNGTTYVAYCWAEISGFSKFGSYTGNGSTDGPFVYCGFRPKYVMIKSTTSADSWVTLDTSRDTYNVANKLLYPNLSNSEPTFNSLDFNSNGFKQRNTDTAQNANGSTYIFAAFAETPFRYSLAR